MPNNLTPAPPTITLLQNEGMSNNESEPLTFEQTLKNIKLGIKLTTLLHSHLQTIDLQKNLTKNYLNTKLIIAIIARKDGTMQKAPLTSKIISNATCVSEHEKWKM